MQNKLRNTIEHIKQVYIDSSLPWVIGYSGGKDSSCLLQIIWQAISEIEEKNRKTEIYVLSSDTMIETPGIIDYIKNNLDYIQDAASRASIPVKVACVKPEIDNTFWVNLLGRGYPAPRTKFRWCTDRLKIEPANKFILDVVSKYGEAIILLGARKEESATRAQVLKKKQAKDQYTAGAILPRHSNLPNSYVFTPISEWTTNEVWEYLLANASTPWGTSNRDLAAMYKNASDGECPLVVDKATPSCGNSRFGCWVCTVVEQNKSLENMVDQGEEWLEPLLEYRNLLMDTTDPKKKIKYRSYKRRTGKVHLQSKGTEGEIKLIRGPYKFEYRKEFLSKLLQTQVQMNHNKEITLITEDELKLIRMLWITEENDWEDSLPKIYLDVTGEELNWGFDDTASFGREELELLEQICNNNRISFKLVARLLDKEREFNAIGRRSSLSKELDSILKQEWRSEEEVLEAYRKKNVSE